MRMSYRLERPTDIELAAPGSDWRLAGCDEEGLVSVFDGEGQIAVCVGNRSSAAGEYGFPFDGQLCTRISGGP
jgi:hypothetical protein